MQYGVAAPHSIGGLASLTRIVPLSYEFRVWERRATRGTGQGLSPKPHRLASVGGEYPPRCELFPNVFSPVRSSLFQRVDAFDCEAAPRPRNPPQAPLHRLEEGIGAGPG
jgi:hypothetical protein